MTHIFEMPPDEAKLLYYVTSIDRLPDGSFRVRGENGYGTALEATGPTKGAALAILFRMNAPPR